MRFLVFEFFWGEYSEKARKCENNPKHIYITQLSQVNICSIKQVILKENKENVSECR